MSEAEVPQTFRQRAKNVLDRLRLRRREPWNWLLQNLSLLLFCPGLLFRSAPLLVLAGLGLAGGLLPLPLPPMQHTELRRLLPWLEKGIGQECAWLARPLDARKKRQAILFVLGAAVTAWLLWSEDLGPIGLALAAAYLLYVRRRNIADGIEP
jgi:hypothetical protein